MLSTQRVVREKSLLVEFRRRYEWREIKTLAKETTQNPEEQKSKSSNSENEDINYSVQELSGNSDSGRDKNKQDLNCTC